MKKSDIVRFGGASVVAVAALLAAQPAFAEDGDIVVTATKRAENIQDVPIPISAVTGEDLAKANANSLSDYIVRLPGVVFNDYQPGVSEVVIRGVAQTTYHEQGQTTTGYYINDIPVVEPGFPIGIPDVDTFDLDRVEVLRGPQGTLFGSSTLGGLINYIVKTADPTKVDAAASGQVGSTKNADGQLNYAAKAMVNVPLIKDVLAVRVLGYQRVDAGYIDNIDTDTKGSNDFRTRGLRGSVVFTPGDTTKITYMSAYQDTKLDDATYVSSVADLTRTNIEHNEAQKTSFFLNSLRLDQDLDFAKLTVLGSVDEKTNTTIFDASYYGFSNGHPTGELSPYSIGHANANIKQIEARLASSGDDTKLQWLVGISYVEAKKHSYDQDIAPGAEDYIDANPVTFANNAALAFVSLAGFPDITGAAIAPGDRIYGYLSDTKNKDFGIFGEVSYRPIPEFEITVGGRYYSNEAQGAVVNQGGLIKGTPGDATGATDQKENGFTPKVTLTVRPTDDVMLYATYAKGYRIGGINPNAGLLPSLPATYDSDTVDNYEAGLKLSGLDRRLLITANVFNIDWHDLQAREFGPGPNYYSYVINAASANIKGVEFSGAFEFVPHVTFGSNITYQEGKLTSFLPDVFAVGLGYKAGTRLPGSSKWSIANNLTFDFPEMSMAPTFEIAHRYLSKAPVAFGNPNTRGGFNEFDLRASFAPIQNIRVMAYLDNVFNVRGLLDGPFAATGALYSITRPRTVGIRLDWNL
ncbi:MAG: TonB-dependent receptor [Candidatus Andeanibacterium colombiense]|uniref:TonB-dependent receptor n=1 Tax=Candidatus Andeanibacterium colombiense TaxID=3121345 RepID=A0AAJ5X5T3_9SPHN|nr:MAG: TonB-dependent receptor [Sphingomonadaceae bacterium]